MINRALDRLLQLAFWMRLVRQAPLGGFFAAEYASRKDEIGRALLPHQRCQRRACHRRITSQCDFGKSPLGCYPPVACTALAALVGQKRAADLVFTGRIFSGEEAAEWGLANEAHPEGELQQAIQRTVDHLMKLSPAALAVAKKAFYAWDSMHLDKGLARAEKIYLEELMQIEDVKEGIAAWMEKRKPVWKGK